MRIMNCSAAIQSVLDEAAARMDALIVLHVEPAADAEPVSLSRRIALPLTEDASLAFAMGCAQAGLKPVLDLTAVRDAGERLKAAFETLPRASRAPLVIRMRARTCPALPGVHVITPSNARECAGAMRFALQAELICLIVENPLSAYEACDVPDDPNDLFAGKPQPDEALIPEAPAPVEPLAEAAAEDAGEDIAESVAPDVEEDAAEDAPEAPAEEEAPAEAPPEEEPAAEDQAADEEEDHMVKEDIALPEAETAPVEAAESTLDEAPESAPDEAGFAPCAPLAFRCRAYDPAELIRTAEKLGVSRARLAEMCCRKAGETAEVVVEADALPGEAACLPPARAAACLWVGCDRLALCWDPRRLPAEDARALMREAAGRLELPVRLILDREGE